MQNFKWITVLLLLGLLIVPFTVAAQDGGDEEETRPDPLGGATEFATLDEPVDVRLMLDWVPNTNHTGIYVAQERGYYDEANLNVEIIEPVDVLPEAALDTGLVEFGIGFQEFTTYAIAEGADVVSVAAIIQENTSGFATISGNHSAERPADLAGLTYGGFSLPDMENAVLSTLLACDDAEWDEGDYLDIGFTDPLALLDRERIDFAWIFYGVQGIQSDVEGRNLDVVMLRDYADCVPNYYTPILLTSGTMIEENPDVVAAFVQATARGYGYTIQNPEEAAGILLDAVPELDEAFVQASVVWFADEYQGDAPRWGQQSAAVWQGFTDFMLDNVLIAEGFDVEAVFTNKFLPGTVSEDTEGDEAETSAEVDTGEVLETSAVQLNEADSFRFRLRYEGQEIVLAEEPILITFSGINADYVSPDRMQTEVLVMAGPTNQSINLLFINDRQYTRSLLFTANEWVELTFLDFDLRDLQSNDAGIAQALRVLEDVTLHGVVERDGDSVYHIEGIVDMRTVEGLTLGTSGQMNDEQVELTLFIRTEDLYPTEIQIKNENNDVWTIYFSRFNTEFDIEAPE